jgi:hypothetical protein
MLFKSLTGSAPDGIVQHTLSYGTRRNASPAKYKNASDHVDCVGRTEARVSTVRLAGKNEVTGLVMACTHACMQHS